MASALSAYARMLTFENRSRRNLYRLAGLAPRTRDKVFSILILVCFVVTFIIPMIASTVYYVFIASPRYASEVRFVLRSSAPMLSRDRYSSSTVEPKAKIVQDTAVQMAPVSETQAMAMLRSLKAFAVLDGARGRRRTDLKAAARAITALSRFAVAQANAVSEIDINPLLLKADGEGAVALDALLVPHTRKATQDH